MHQDCVQGNFLMKEFDCNKAKKKQKTYYPLS